MTIKSDATAPEESSVGRASRGGTKVSPRARRGWRVRSVALAILVAGFAGFNSWWYWRDIRPIPDRKTIAALMTRQDYASAEAALREILRRSPNDGEARMTLARTLGARNDLLGCARQLHQVPFWWPKKREALFREGSVYLLLDRAKAAEEAWLAVVKDDPLHPVPVDIFHDATFELLKLYATGDRWEDAFVVLWRAYDEASPSDRVTLLTWRLRSELERVAPLESLPLLRRYVAAVPDDWESLRCIARAEQALGRLDEAQNHLQDCLKARPDDRRVWRDYLTLLHERGDRDAFVAGLKRVPTTVVGEPEILKFQGLAKEYAGDLEGAAESYRQANILNPNVIEYHYRLAIAEERLGHREQASENRKRAQELRDARAKLPQAFADFMSTRNARESDTPKLKSSIGSLATICETLGFSRAADGWKLLGQSL